MMKKVKFICGKSAICVEPVEEVFEIKDNTTEDEIDEMFDEWIFDKLDVGWSYVEENEKK